MKEETKYRIWLFTALLFLAVGICFRRTNLLVCFILVGISLVVMGIAERYDN